MYPYMPSHNPFMHLHALDTPHAPPTYTCMPLSTSHMHSVAFSREADFHGLVNYGEKVASRLTLGCLY